MARLNFVSFLEIPLLNVFGFGWAIRDIFAIDLEVENKTATILGFMLRKVGAGALVACTDRYCGYLLVYLIGTGQQHLPWDPPPSHLYLVL